MTLDSRRDGGEGEGGEGREEGRAELDFRVS